MRRETLEVLLRARQSGRPLALITCVDSGAEALIAGPLDPQPLPEPSLVGLSEGIVTAARAALVSDRSGLLPETLTGGRRLFLKVHAASPRLILVGAVHIAQALAPMAAMAGYGVTLVDPRGAFATPLRFPGITLDDRWPDDALAALAPDSRTAVVTLSHDPKLDDPALLVALPSTAFYVGALGSSRTHAQRVERLAAAGLAASVVDRLHAPVGLDIGARLPAEIAVAVLADIIQTRAGIGSVARKDGRGRVNSDALR